MKRMLGTITLLAVSLLVGCGKTEQVKTEATAASQTSSASAETAVAKEAKIEMNLADIVAHNYTSIAGEWHDMAVSVNKQNARGFVWEGARGDKLTVTAQELQFGDYATLKGAELILTNETRQLEFKKEKDGKIVGADSYEGAVPYNLMFYPKGVALEDWGDDLPQDLSTENERIIFRTKSFVQVFERDGTSEPKIVNHVAFKMEAIEKADYTSANGTWRNAKGETIVVKGNRIELSDIQSYGDKTLPATVSGLTIDIPSENDTKGQPLETTIGATDTIPVYSQKLNARKEEGAVYLQGTAYRAMLLVAFIPSGATGGVGTSDTTKDRMVTLITQNSLEGNDGSYVYYKASEE